MFNEYFSHCLMFIISLYSMKLYDIIRIVGYYWKFQIKIEIFSNNIQINFNIFFNYFSIVILYKIKRMFIINEYKHIIVFLLTLYNVSII